MDICFIHLNRFSENLAKINKSEHEPYTSKEFFHCIRCLANILPDKGPTYAKEKTTALAIGPQNMEEPLGLPLSHTKKFPQLYWETPVARAVTLE